MPTTPKLTIGMGALRLSGLQKKRLKEGGPKGEGMNREALEAMSRWARKNAIKPDENDKYNLLDLLSLPLSETYKDILRENHSEEWIKGLEEAIRDRKDNKN